jgi:hypothetical protein
MSWRPQPKLNSPRFITPHVKWFRFEMLSTKWAGNNRNHQFKLTTPQQRDLYMIPLFNVKSK